MRLSHKEFDVLQRAMLEFHDQPDLESLRRAVPGIFLRLIPADYFAWMVTDFNDPLQPMGEWDLWESSRRLAGRHVRKLLELLADHPFTLHAVKTGDWGPLRLSDFVSKRELLASRLHREVYRHVGIGRLLACATFRGQRVGTLNLSRPLADRDFSERDRLVLKLLQPHFLQALRAAELNQARLDAATQPLSSLGLTPREVQIAGWIARGRSNPEIASILGMRPRTVEKHVEKILAKLGVENRTAAAMVIAGAPSPPPQLLPALERKSARR
jgi:DNA-binding CsgD family transcriptional regulator